ncbi:mucin-2 isoform X2 [Lutzomyia longipalpis]|uniref:mucin-2 isoform X2 n=1 Tax=Lutzomyia longipalpis TaxID=7200 RepID=UPI002483CDFA|nr:mucin-2 isoform X2 [Lutzomyia longipalpis]
MHAKVEKNILKTTRHPELFEISPRPFTGQSLRNNGFQYQRIPPTAQVPPGGVPLPPQPLVPDFPPRNLPPHQAADLFLNQIGLEQGIPGEIPNQRTFPRGPPFRPEQTGTRPVNPPSRNDKTQSNRNPGAFKASIGDDYLTSQDETFRSRNRYRGNGVSTTEPPVDTKNTRGKPSKGISPDAIELSRKTPPARKIQKELLLNEQLLRSRPVPYDQPAAIPPFPRNPEPPKINISHNGSTKQSNELPTLEDNYPDYFYDTVDDNLMAKIKKPNESQIDVKPDKPTEKKKPESRVKEVKEESASQEQINPNVYVPNIQSLHDTSKHIRDNKASLEETHAVEQPTEPPKTEVVTEKEEKPEDHTVILTSNFYLPENLQNDEAFVDDPPVENAPAHSQSPNNTPDINVQSDDEEYEYEDYADDEEDANIPQITTANPTVEVPTEKPSNIDGEGGVISVVTTKSTLTNSSAMNEETETPSNIASPINSENTSTTTESWVVIASVQTSRSVSGARFLPFPQVEQEEKKQVLSDLDKDGKASDEDTRDDDLLERNVGNSTPEQEQDFTTITNMEEAHTDSVPEATSHSSPASHGTPQSTESIIDKLDRVQSELSSGVLTGKFPILNETLVEITTKSTPVVVKKFSPRTTTTTTPSTTTTRKPDIKKLVFETLPMDDLVGLLPAGYKSRASYKNKKIPTTTTALPEIKNTSGLASLMNNILVQDVSVLGLLPKDYKINESTTQEPAAKSPADVLLQKAQKVDISAFLPPGYVASSTTPKANTKKPLTVTVEDDISKFLPPGYKLPKTTKMPSTTSTTTTASPPVAIIDDISKFLPPGFKLNATIEKSEKIDISKFLPANYTEKPQEITTASTTTSAAPKVVFPSRPGFLAKKPGQRLTTPKTVENAGPVAPDIVIRHGPPTRATTEFTGWPTPSTTPFSIEKLLERQRTSTIEPQDFFSASTTTRTTTTTTTKATTQRPTEPGVCQSDCDLAATIKIVGGVMWKPELLDHNTDEWKSLAHEMESQLNSVYGKHAELSKWFKKVRIDSFSKGSVLVDYFVELTNMPRHINTLELKKLFHSALKTVTTEPPEYTTEFDGGQTDAELDDDFGPIVRERVIEPKVAKETLQLGQFIIDPISTDFIVIPKQIAPTVEFAEENQLLPQWAIAVIVIGVGSLLFVIIFGVTVLLNRKNKAKKKAPAPLTTDMLNELNKNHMGGVENYGHEEFYNVEDGWDDDTDARHHDVKSKRYAHPAVNTQSNIYDSWRSQRHPSSGYYYDSHQQYPQKIGPYPADAFMDYHQAPTQHNSMPMYTYNPRRYRDYDEDF